MSIRVLIADDEMLARARIQQMLVAENDAQVVGECEDGREVIAAVRVQRPDLLFLDIQMPLLNGVEALRSIPEPERPLTIFVTAHAQHAFEAFQVHAVDYLLKPFTAARFREAFQRARDQLQVRLPVLPAPAPVGSPKNGNGEGVGRIAVKTSDRTVFLDVQEIDYIEAAANYAILHVGGQTYVQRESLTSLEEKLPAERFLRVNRSLIANLGFLKEVRHGRHRGRVATLKNGKQFSLTCGVREVRSRLENL